MTIHQMECLLETAKTLSLTEATSRLHIFQQGLSRQIVSLEKELELHPLDRAIRDVRLIRSGELLLWYWKNILKEISDSVDVTREKGKRAKSRINVAVMGMNGIIGEAGSLLTDYTAVDPDTEFKISKLTSIKDMTVRSPDLMTVVSFLSTHEQLGEKCGILCIGKSPLYYVVPKKNSLVDKEEVPIEDSGEETISYLYKNSFVGAEMYLFELLSKQEHVLQKARFYENVNSPELALIASEGIHISFKELYHSCRDHLKLSLLPDAENQVSASMFMVWWKENEKRFENFIKYLKKLCNQQHAVINYLHFDAR